MTPREVVRRALLSSLGVSALALEGCAADAGAGAAGDVVGAVPTVTATTTTTSSVVTPRPSASIPIRTPAKPSSGYELAKQEYWHRTGPARCDAAIDLPSCRGDEEHRSCQADADCKDAPFGKCLSWKGQVGDGCSCAYACETDADCAKSPGTVCMCKEPGRMAHSECVPARCEADDACTSGVCGVSSYHNGCHRTVQLACKTVNDDCQSDADCPTAETCAYAEKGDAWKCQRSSCRIGRPLVVDGRWARASDAFRSDWITRSASHRDAAHWLEMAALEHASVASFARFSLQLLALGAPADLVRDAHCAAMDEIEHARIAYGLASSALGRPVGPGELFEARSSFSLDVGDVVRALVAEGCVGETIGAIEALEEAEATDDPELARVLRRIGEDELRHAELAYRALAWMVRAFDTDVMPAVLEALAEWSGSPERRSVVDDVVAATMMSAALV